MLKASSRGAVARGAARVYDWNNRAAAATNSTGAIVEAYDTDAYGNTLIFTAPDPSGNWFSSGATQSAFGANEIIFCGYRFDPETILYHVRNRTYGPALGRWIQRDPLWYVDGENLYEYVEGLASGAADPFGLAAVIKLVQVHNVTAVPGWTDWRGSNRSIKVWTRKCKGGDKFRVERVTDTWTIHYYVATVGALLAAHPNWRLAKTFLRSCRNSE